VAAIATAVTAGTPATTIAASVTTTGTAISALSGGTVSPSSIALLRFWLLLVGHYFPERGW